jgi:hypothetical protein
VAVAAASFLVNLAHTTLASIIHPSDTALAFLLASSVVTVALPLKATHWGLVNPSSKV